MKDKRGARLKYSTSDTAALDAYARIFSAHPYSALILPTTQQDKIYLCTARDSFKLEDNDINEYNKQILLLSTNNNPSTKIDLFLYSLVKQNAISLNIFKKTIAKIDKGIRSGDIKDVNPAELTDLRKLAFSKKITLHSLNKKTTLIEYIKQKIKKELFDEFLSADELVLINKIIKSNYTIEEIKNETQIHVEAFGVYNLYQKNPTLNKFDIGLSKSDGDRDVGCCGACCIDFREMKSQLGIDVSRTADYIRSIPPTNAYKPAFAKKELLTKKQVYESNVDDLIIGHNNFLDKFDELQNLLNMSANDLNVLLGILSNKDDYQYLKDQFGKWASALWDKKTKIVSNDLSSGKVDKKEQEEDNSKQGSRENKALKYWQSQRSNSNLDYLDSYFNDNKDAFIEELKEEKIFQGLAQDSKDAIIQYLDKISRFSICKYLLSSNFLQQDNSVNLREGLLSKIAEIDNSVNNLKKRPLEQHQDPTEFLESLYLNIFGVYKATVSIKPKNSNDESLYKSKPQREEKSTAIIQLEINDKKKVSELFSSLNKTENLIDKNRVEFEKIDGNDIEKIEATRTVTTIIPTDNKEICFNIKRFAVDSKIKVVTKINTLIELDDITVNDQGYEITAFIRHIGQQLQAGHYVTYIKENDGKWYEYDDNKRKEVSDSEERMCYGDVTLAEAKGNAYVVKYSLQDTESLLPDAQVGIANNTGAICWLNSSVVFTKSFTTLHNTMSQVIHENPYTVDNLELLECIKYNGFNPYHKNGLVAEDIEYNLKQLKASQQEYKSDITVSDKIIDSNNILSNLTKWIKKSEVGEECLSVIGIKNDDELHACVIQVISNNQQLNINIIDPLSEEDSEFKAQLSELQRSIEKELAQYTDLLQCNIIYSGVQDVGYGTCGDMCLIMIQQLLENAVCYNQTDNTNIYSTRKLLNQLDHTNSCDDLFHDHNIDLAGDMNMAA